MRSTLFLTVLAILVSISLLAQDDPIELNNPSFEDFARASKEPRGWYDCGFAGETPPDVQPSGGFEVFKPAFNGRTYLGMVVRDNDTWESVSQRLSRPLEGGQCYEFSLHISRSELYVSVSRSTDNRANYTTPAKVRIWGGNEFCDKREMLAETSLIVNTRWLQYDFRFEPKQDYSFIIFEAFYKTPTLFPYNGNVLLDNASAIQPVPCEEEQVEEPIVQNEESEDEPERINVSPQTTTTVKTPAPKSKPEESTAETTRPPAPSKNRSLIDMKREELRAGMTFQLNNIYFEVNKSEIRKESNAVLDTVYRFMMENDDIVIEVGGHTNGRCTNVICDQISEERAKSVVSYLAGRGIERNRLFYKGYGKRKPIATNDTEEGRKRNQRVEIKILGFTG